jgi:hypothetical protein
MGDEKNGVLSVIHAFSSPYSSVLEILNSAALWTSALKLRTIIRAGSTA